MLILYAVTRGVFCHASLNRNEIFSMVHFGHRFFSSGWEKMKSGGARLFDATNIP